MNLIELKEKVDRAIESAREYGDNPREVPVSIQIDSTVPIDPKYDERFWSDDIELFYDGDAQASGCVLHGWSTGEEGVSIARFLLHQPKNKDENQKPAERLRGVNLQLTTWQTAMLRSFFIKAREKYQREDPGCILAQIFESSTPNEPGFMEVRIVDGEMGRKMQAILGTTGNHHPDGKPREVNIFVPDDEKTS